MATPNPACTNGWTTVDPTTRHRRGHCGCGWSETGFDSKSAALRAQKAHRFPGNTAATAAPVEADLFGGGS